MAFTQYLPLDLEEQVIVRRLASARNQCIERREIDMAEQPPSLLQGPPEVRIPLVRRDIHHRTAGNAPVPEAAPDMRRPRQPIGYMSEGDPVAAPDVHGDEAPAAERTQAFDHRTGKRGHPRRWKQIHRDRRPAGHR